jgi:hypothetical protein
MSRRRVFTLGAAVVVAAALAGAAVGPAAPAYAEPGLTVALSPSSVDLKGGDSRPVAVKLTNAGPPARVTVTVTAPTGLAGDVTVTSSDSTCSGSGSSVVCTVDLPGDTQKAVVVTLVARSPDSLGSGQSRTDTSGTVSVATPLRTTSTSYAVTLHGPAPAQSPTPKAPPASGVTRTSAGQPTGSATGADASSGTADPSASDSPAGLGYEAPTSPAATVAGDPGGLSGLLIGAGALLVGLGGAIIATLVVRHRRAPRTGAGEPAREPANAFWPTGEADLRPGSAPVDPWDAYPC